MKNVKNLIEVIKSALASSLKAKIIAGVVGVTVVSGVAGGGYYLYTTNANRNELEATQLTQKEIDKLNLERKEAVRTEEEKAKDEKMKKLNGLKVELKELDPSISLEDNVKDEDVDKLIEDYTKKKNELVVKKEEESKKEEEKKKEELAQNTETPSQGSGGSSNNSGTSNSGSGNSNPGTAPEQPVQTPTPPPVVPQEPVTPPPAPNRPASGNKPEVAAEVQSRMGSNNTPNSSMYTPGQFNTVMSLVDGWFNGSQSKDSINSTMRTQFKSETDFPIQVTGAGIITVPGLDATSIVNSLFINFGYATNAFNKCTIYYDSDSDTSTVKYICGSN